MIKEFKRLKDGRWYWRVIHRWVAAANIHNTRREARNAYKNAKVQIFARVKGAEI